MTIYEALFPTRRERSEWPAYRSHHRAPYVTAFGYWLWWHRLHVEIDIFPRRVWPSGTIHWWPRVRIRVWLGPYPHAPRAKFYEIMAAW